MRLKKDRWPLWVDLWSCKGGAGWESLKVPLDCHAPSQKHTSTGAEMSFLPGTLIRHLIDLPGKLLVGLCHFSIWRYEMAYIEKEMGDVLWDSTNREKDWNRQTNEVLLLSPFASPLSCYRCLVWFLYMQSCTGSAFCTLEYQRSRAFCVAGAATWHNSYWFLSRL